MKDSREFYSLAGKAPGLPEKDWYKFEKPRKNMSQPKLVADFRGRGNPVLRIPSLPSPCPAAGGQRMALCPKGSEFNPGASHLPSLR
jgi:hypothetical protein